MGCAGKASLALPHHFLLARSQAPALAVIHKLGKSGKAVIPAWIAGI